MWETFDMEGEVFFKILYFQVETFLDQKKWKHFEEGENSKRRYKDFKETMYWDHREFKKSNPSSTTFKTNENELNVKCV